MSTDLLQPGGGLTKSKLALADATAGDVLSGKKFYAGDKVIKTGSMANRGTWGVTLYPRQVVSVPQGYHNGQGQVISYVWNGEKYLYFMCQCQGGYGSGPIAEHVATLIGDGGASHEPAFFAHESPMLYGSANVCGAGMISVAPNDDTGVAKITALARIRNIFNSAVYNPGTVFTMTGGAPACFRFE